MFDPISRNKEAAKGRPFLVYLIRLNMVWVEDMRTLYTKKMPRVMTTHN